MEKEIHKIQIFPARYIKNIEEKKKFELKLLLDDAKNIQNREMSYNLIKDIKHPDYLFVSIMTGIGCMVLSVCDANEYGKMFNEKWSEL